MFIALSLVQLIVIATNKALPKTVQVLLELLV